MQSFRPPSPFSFDWQGKLERVLMLFEVLAYYLDAEMDGEL